MSKIALQLSLMSCIWLLSSISSADAPGSFPNVSAEDLFKMPVQDRLRIFKQRAFEEQYEIYIYGQQNVEPPSMDLAQILADEGIKVVKPLEEKLLQTQDDLTIRDILLVFDFMASSKTYGVATDQALMKILRERVDSIRDPCWKDICTRELEEILTGIRSSPVPYYATKPAEGCGAAET